MGVKKEVRDYLCAEHKIYDGFTNKAVMAQFQGLLRDTALTNRVGGLAVTARHPKLAKQLTGITTSLRQQVPCYAYDSTSEHSTLCSQAWDNFQYDKKYNAVLLGLKDTVVTCLAALTQSQLQDLTVRYLSPLYNRTTVIFPGAARPAYVDLLLRLADQCQKKTGIGIAASWGTHITAARFTREVAASQAKGFFTFMEEAPALGENKLERIDIAWIETGYNHFQYSVFQQFVLSADGFRPVS